MGTYPQVAIVGIMRDEPDTLRYVASRFRDFTPQQWHLPGPFEGDNAMATFGTGGGSDFLDLIEQQATESVWRALICTLPRAVGTLTAVWIAFGVLRLLRSEWALWQVVRRSAIALGGVDRAAGSVRLNRSALVDRP